MQFIFLILGGFFLVIFVGTLIYFLGGLGIIKMLGLPGEIKEKREKENKERREKDEREKRLAEELRKKAEIADRIKPTKLYENILLFSIKAIDQEILWVQENGKKLSPSDSKSQITIKIGEKDCAIETSYQINSIFSIMSGDHNRNKKPSYLLDFKNYGVDYLYVVEQRNFSSVLCDDLKEKYFELDVSWLGDYIYVKFDNLYNKYKREVIY